MEKGNQIILGFTSTFFKFVAKDLGNHLCDREREVSFLYEEKQ